MNRPSESAGLSDSASKLFEETRGIPPAERSGFLDERCGGDPLLRAQVESMLVDSGEVRTKREMNETIDPSTAAAADLRSKISPSNRPSEPKQIGAYKLLEQIGEGGFGTVWVADQTAPVKRRVALKIIKLGMDSRAIVARFEQERQALAIMDHANIAKVLDAGTAPDGRPYFVMEYVAGESITSYCDRNRLNVKQRLELFLSVCDAVQHAHHKGIIHRDIKPSNVLVSQTVGFAATVKVIDFGVAKALNHTLTDKTLFTEHGQILGTPEYMSPEQAEMGAMDIDTRVDVYSLGVLLYELLTGALPFEPRDLRSKGYNEIQRIIREVDPPNPSTRLRSLDNAKSAEIAQRRHAKLDELEGQLRRELEWIPLKAMRKDRDQRYATPVAMADDIRNHLAGRPLVAGPESAIYRAKKFIRRNRFGVAAAAMVLLALMLGAIVSTIGFVRAARNARLAQEQTVRAEGEAARANKEADRAKAEAQRLWQTNIYNTSLLAQANPTAGERKDITVRELLDVAASQLDNGAQKGQPRIEAALRATLAQTYRSLSLYDASQKQWARALDLETTAAGQDTPEAAYAMTGLGQISLDLGDTKEAGRLLKQALLIQREQLSGDDPYLADTLNNLGVLSDATGDAQGAKTFYQQALDIYQKHPENAPGIADAMTNLAISLNKLGDNKQAIDLATKALALRRARFGEQHIDVWHSLVALANFQLAEDNLVEAEKTSRQAMTLSQQLVDEKNRKTVQSIQALSRTLWLTGTPAALTEAAKLQTHAIELSAAINGEDSVQVAQATDMLACIVRDQGQMDQAVELFRRALELREAKQGPDHPDAAAEMSNLADSLTRAGKPQEAIPLAKRALEIRKAKLPAGHWVIWNTTSVLGGAYAAAGDFTQGEPLLLESFKGLESGSALGKRPRIDAATRLVNLYEKWGKLDQAERWRQTRTELAAAPAKS